VGGGGSQIEQAQDHQRNTGAKKPPRSELIAGLSQGATRSASPELAREIIAGHDCYIRQRSNMVQECFNDRNATRATGTEVQSRMERKAGVAALVVKAFKLLDPGL
jgi:hypothetical protein